MVLLLNILTVKHTFDVVRSAGSTKYNYVNPVRRDVVSTGFLGDNVTVRFVTDNSGPWFFHWWVFTFQIILPRFTNIMLTAILISIWRRKTVLKYICAAVDISFSGVWPLFLQKILQPLPPITMSLVSFADLFTLQLTVNGMFTDAWENLCPKYNKFHAHIDD